MKIFFRRCYIGISWVSVVFLVILAVLLSVGRILSPAVQDYLPEIREQAARALGQPVNIASIDIRWHGIAPSLHLGDVQVLDQEGGQSVLNFEHIYIHVDFYRLLAEQIPVPSRVTFSGSQLTLELREDKRLVIPGIRLMQQERTTDFRELMASLKGITFSLLKSDVQWINRVDSAAVRFSPVNVGMAIEDGLILVEGNIGLPEELGKQLRLHARLDGDFWVKDGWGVIVHGDVQGLKFEGIPSSSYFRFAGLLEKGQGDVKFWLDWSKGRMNDLGGRFNVKNLTWDSALSKGKANSQYVLDHARGLFQWKNTQQGWMADFSQLQVRIGDHEWPQTDVSVRFDKNQSYQRFMLSADYLHMGEVAAIALSRSELGDRERKLLQRYQPNGALKDVNLNILFNDKNPELYSARAEFQDLSWAAYKKIPGVTGLDGSFSLDEQSGEMQLQAQDAQLDYPALFLESLQILNLNGDIAWRKDASDRYRVQGRQLKLASPDIHGEGMLDLGLGAGPADMDLKVAFYEGDGSQVAKYLPAGILQKPIYNWLVHALKGGYVPEGQVLFKGAFQDFPFDNGEGIFVTRFTARDVLLDYWKGWPRIEDLAGEVEFRNQGMTIDVSGGRLFDSQITTGSVRIRNLPRARLLVDAKASGPLADVFSYLSNSPLGQGKEALLNDLKAQGLSDLSLSINLPISKKLKPGVAVNGVLDIQSCGIEFVQQRLKFTDLIGQLDFTENSVNADNATARIDGSDLAIDAKTLSNGSIRVAMQGNLKPAVLMRDLDPELRRHFSGSSDWVATLKIPGLDKNSAGKIHLNLNSDLKGVASDLPAPLNKQPEDIWPVDIGMYLIQDASQKLSIDLQGRLSARLELNREVPAGLERAHLQFGAGESRLPSTGIELSGTLDEINADAWKEVGLSLQDKEGRQQASIIDKLSRLNLYLKKVDIFDRTLHNLRVNAVRQQGEWKTLIDSAWISGTIYQPEDQSSRKPLRMELDYLSLSHPDLESRSHLSLKPDDFPSISFSSKRLDFGGHEMSNVNLSAAKRANGLRIHALSFDAEGFSGRLNGDWLGKNDGSQQTTSLTYNLIVSDLGQATDYMKWDAGLTKGEGRIFGTVNWNGGPTEFSYKNNLQGKVNLELAKGIVTDVESGAGKVLGLFNLDALGKRIRMDFSDVQEKGYSYDRWDAQMNVAGPVITSTNMEIRGSSANLMLSGQGNIERRDMDIYLDVIPQIYSAVPIAGAVIAGPAAGAALYLLSKIPGFNDALGKGTKLEYHLTGPWDAPQVEQLNVDLLEDEEDEEGAFF